MTAKEKQGFGLYFLFAFGMAWLLQVYASLLLLRTATPRPTSCCWR